MCLLMLMMVEDGPRADGLQIVSGNYYHWWIMNKYYYIIILGGRVLISSSCMYYSISNTVLGWLGLMEMEGRRCV